MPPSGWRRPPTAWPAVLGEAVVGDVDGDGHADVVALGRGAVTVRRGSARGLVGSTAFAPVGPHRRAETLADVNHDGRQDLVTTHCSYADPGYPARAWLEVRPGQAAGRFGPPTTFSLAGNTADVLVVTDLNGDGWPDVLALALHTGQLAVLLNQKQP